MFCVVKRKVPCTTNGFMESDAGNIIHVVLGHFRHIHP